MVIQLKTLLFFNSGLKKQLENNELESTVLFTRTVYLAYMTQTSKAKYVPVLSLFYNDQPALANAVCLLCVSRHCCVVGEWVLYRTAIKQ